MPRWHAVRKCAFAQSSFNHEPIKQAQSSYPHGLTVKYSGTKEAFSLHASRGRDSSGQRRSYGFDPDLPEKVKYAADNAPNGTLAIVFQELADLSVIGVLVHAYIQQETITLEIIYNTGRMLMIFDDHVLIHNEISGAFPFHVFPLEHGFYILELLIKLRDFLYDNNEGWNIEGFWETQKGHFKVFQLRPIPMDRPSDCVKIFSLENSIRPEWSTRFTWGKFDITLPENQKDWQKNGIILRKAHEKCLPNIVTERIQAKQPVLLIDALEGFRLSHEPWNLPAYDLRENYNYVYIPELIVNTMNGSSINIHSNGDVASLTRSSK